MSKKGWITKLLLGGGALLALGACGHPRQAQRAECVEVTGTHVKKPKTDLRSRQDSSISPLRIIDRRELERTGEVELDRALKKTLPAAR